MEIGDTSEEAVNINLTTTESVEKTELAENGENTEKLGNTIMVPKMFIFTLAVENLQYNCDQCSRPNSSEKGLTQHSWMGQYPNKDFRHYRFDYCSQHCEAGEGYWLQGEAALKAHSFRDADPQPVIPKKVAGMG